MEEYDVLVIGGGIAGISIACELAVQGQRVVVLEAESTLAFHTTGRSAATWVGSYGTSPVRALTVASHDYFVEPPRDRHDPSAGPLGLPMTMLHLAPHGFGDELIALHQAVVGLIPEARIITAAETVARVPVLRLEWVDSALLEPGALDLDVAGLHQGYKRGFRANGGEIRTNARVTAARRLADRWEVTVGSGQVFRASYVVNAAGAWVDQVAGLFGVAGVGIEPRLRSVFMVGAGSAAERAPLVLTIDHENGFYFKSDAGQYLCSPADTTLTTPHDAKPDELEIARAIEVINEATTLDIRAIRTPWAGLRSFVADSSPVIGPDPETPGFFWYAGQAGNGIQMAPAAARLGAALLLGREVPSDIAALGFDLATVLPDRLR